MGQAAIVVNGLSKQYQLGAVGGAFQYELLRDAMSSAAAAVLRRLSGPSAAGAARPRRAFWALKDVTLTIPRGQVVGIIGRNGAGKSTLLKILSRVTRPTAGYADLFGRVGSLLEVGTGFHPELTGRENIFLNGAVLGMRRSEIARSFDAIVDFSGVAPFLDTPVKRYSSGMYVRLAFAVAAHLQTEILLVDEVLAVGDAEFQRKCLGRMQDVTREGRTILFVSHNMTAVKALCERAVLLDGGRVVADGAVDDVLDAYLASGISALEDGRIPDAVHRSGSGEARFMRASLGDEHGRAKRDFHLGEPLAISIELQVSQPVADAVIEVGISTADGIRVATVFSVDEGRTPRALSAGTYCCRVELDAMLLPRTYAVDLGLHRASYGTTIDWVERVTTFAVMDGSRSGQDRYFASQTRGFFRPSARWQLEQPAGASPAPRQIT